MYIKVLFNYIFSQLNKYFRIFDFVKNLTSLNVDIPSNFIHRREFKMKKIELAQTSHRIVS